ncbi:MAG: type I glutamate--ammonia ligase [Planctomycetota bacterium]|nr:MAG: type I glutamate--ammonia ligase [Planctomycetota bacterium]
MTPKEVIALAADKQVRYVDLRFNDFPGTWQHFSVPVDALEIESFEKGFAFDGSSIRGWKSINESDMLVVPDPATAFIDPFAKHPTLVLIGDVKDPITHQEYARDPRSIARRAEAYVASTGIGDKVYIGPEAEFFIFDDVRFEDGTNHSFYRVDSVEGAWNTGRDEGPNLGHKPRSKGGYFPVPPVDKYQDLRTEMCLNLEACGLKIERQHHEVATGGQAEINFRFAELTRCADNLMIFKYVVKNTAFRSGKTVTFMPKPLFADNGSGMHCHWSIWKGNANLMAGEKYAGLSDEALFAIGGILKHAPALVAFTNPTTNSYKRLVAGFEAPVNLAYSARNRSAAIRVPMGDSSPKAKRIEFRCPDPSSNPYLAFAAITMAAMDGIQNKIHPGEPLDKDIYDLPPEEKARVPSTPFSLAHALDNLERDHEWLLKGDVFNEDLIRNWIEYKRVNEVDPVRVRPHPHEFALYYDI